jgi:hypothetical protein
VENQSAKMKQKDRDDSKEVEDDGKFNSENE